MEANRTALVGKLIRSTREKHSLTSTDLYTRTAGLVTPSRPATFERGIRRPDIEDVEAIAEAIGDVSVGWLLPLNDNIALRHDGAGCFRA